MKRAVVVAAVAGLFSGCVVATTQPSQPTFSGEVWNWDEARSTVTLLNGGQTTRVRVSPEEIRGLRLHQFAVVHGQVDPPAPIEQVVAVTGPTTPVPSGQPQSFDTTGTISAIDPNGLVSVDSSQGRLVVWSATPDTSRFRPGTPAHVRVSVQPVDLVPLADPRALAAAKEPQPAALATTEPGDHAMVIGRVMRVDPSGTITVDSPRGPVTVAVPNARVFRDGMTVEVRTLVQAGP
jgi:hypothetical protein